MSRLMLGGANSSNSSVASPITNNSTNSLNSSFVGRSSPNLLPEIPSSNFKWTTIQYLPGTQEGAYAVELRDESCLPRKTVALKCIDGYDQERMQEAIEKWRELGMDCTIGTTQAIGKKFLVMRFFPEGDHEDRSFRLGHSRALFRLADSFTDEAALSAREQLLLIAKFHHDPKPHNVFFEFIFGSDRKSVAEFRVHPIDCFRGLRCNSGQSPPNWILNYLRALERGDATP